MSTKIIRPNLSTDTYKVEGNQFTKITSCNNESITGETYAFPHGDIELMSVLGEKIFICPNYRTARKGIYDEDIQVSNPSRSHQFVKSLIFTTKVCI